MGAPPPRCRGRCICPVLSLAQHALITLAPSCVAPLHPHTHTVQAQALIQRLHWVGTRKAWPFCCLHVPRPLGPRTHHETLQGGRDEGVRG